MKEIPFMNRLMKWLLALSVVAAAHAQPTLQATIPFDFIVNGARLPAGEYRVGHFLAPNAVSVHSEKADAMASFFTQPVEKLDSRDSAQLVFHRYGSRYFLYEVWRGDPHNGLQLSESKFEREMKARKGAPTENIVALR